MESGDEDELATGARDFAKRRDKLLKAGYVEGATKARDEVGHIFGLQCDPWITSAYHEVSKLIGVVCALSDLNDEKDEGLEKLEHNLDSFSTYLVSSCRTTENQVTAIQLRSQVEAFIQELKNLCPDSSLLEDLFSASDDPPPSSGPTAPIIRDMKNLTF